MTGKPIKTMLLSSAKSLCFKRTFGVCDGPWYTSSAGTSYNLDAVGQGPIALAVSAGGGCLDILLSSILSSLSSSLWETA